MADNNFDQVPDNSDDDESTVMLTGIQGGNGIINGSIINNNNLYLNELTAEQAISNIGTGLFQFKLILITGILWSTDAMEMMILTLIQPIIIETWNLTEWSSGCLALSVYGGMFFGTFTLGSLSDRVGRRIIVVICIIGYSIFSLLSSFSINLYMLLLTRFIVGIFIGGNAVAFTLFAEFLPTKKRGRMLVVQQAFWCFGALYSSTLGWYTLDFLNWRYYLMLSSIPLWCISLFSVWIPESPQYLIATQKYEEAAKLLTRIADTNNYTFPVSSTLIINYLNGNGRSRGRLSDVFITKYRFTSILLYLMLITSVFSYFGLSFMASRIFELIRGDEYEEITIETISEIPALLIGIVVIDRVGRKTTLSTCFMIYSITCLLLCFDAIRDVPAFGVTLVFIGRMSSSLAFMTQFIYFSEYYPTIIRATAIGGASSLDEISKIGADYLAEDVDDISKGMVIFGCIGIISLIAALLLPTETLGIELKTNVDRSKSESKTNKTKHKINNFIVKIPLTNDVGLTLP